MKTSTDQGTGFTTYLPETWSDIQLLTRAANLTAPEGFDSTVQIAWMQEQPYLGEGLICAYWQREGTDPDIWKQLSEQSRLKFRFCVQAHIHTDLRVIWDVQTQQGTGWRVISNQSNSGEYPPIVVNSVK